jgi:hypothetical protein
MLGIDSVSVGDVMVNHMHHDHTDTLVDIPRSTISHTGEVPSFHYPSLK